MPLALTRSFHQFPTNYLEVTPCNHQKTPESFPVCHDQPVSIFPKYLLPCSPQNGTTRSGAPPLMQTRKRTCGQLCQDLYFSLERSRLLTSNRTPAPTALVPRKCPGFIAGFFSAVRRPWCIPKLRNVCSSSCPQHTTNQPGMHQKMQMVHPADSSTEHPAFFGRDESQGWIHPAAPGSCSSHCIAKHTCGAFPADFYICQRNDPILLSVTFLWGCTFLFVQPNRLLTF